MTTDRALFDEAVALATEAGAMTLRWFQQRDLDVITKSDGTPVTEADQATERFLRDEISRRYPHDAIIGEEHDDDAGTSGRTWIIDPIDGTKAFTQGVPLYSTLLSVVDEAGPAIGVIVLPALDEVVAAGRGLGCFHDGRPTGVSTHDRVDDAYVMTSEFGYWDGYPLDQLLQSGCKLRTWGDAYGYALVATGRAEAMIDPLANLWDVAPMQVIIDEAGGQFSDVEGQRRIDGGSGLATNGTIHDEWVAMLQAKT